jgi:hypothetical protein
VTVSLEIPVAQSDWLHEFREPPQAVINALQRVNRTQCDITVNTKCTGQLITRLIYSHATYTCRQVSHNDKLNVLESCN